VATTAEPPTPAARHQAERAAEDPPDLRRRITYLMLFRLVLISLVLGATVVISLFNDVDLDTPSSLALLGLIGLTYLLTIIYALAINRVQNRLRFAYTQLGIDLVLAALLVHITGGAQSAYSFFFPVSIIGAATVRFRRGAFVATLVSIVLYCGISVSGWLHVLPVPEGTHLLPSDLAGLALVRAMALNVAAFSAVGFLAVNLGGQLQRTSASLAVERTVAADLYALHEHIVRCLSSGLITIDDRGHILAANQAARDLLQVDRPSLAGVPLKDLSPSFHRALGPLVEQGAVRRDEVTVSRADGQNVIFGVSVSPLFNHKERPIGRIINFQDLTEMRAMEAHVRQAERLAAIGTVAAGVAHELRNPLASISGSIELLRSGDGGAEENRSLMDIVTREVDRLDQLVAELLDYTNPRPRESVFVNLTQLTDETLQVFRRDRQFAHVSVQLLDRSGRLPVTVVGDPGQLRQVLWNLLRNAAEVAPRDGGVVQVEVDCIGKTVKIDVADNGPGIPQEAMPRIFEPFFTTRRGGTGLGLAIVRNIVVEHEGTIDVTTRPSGGTCFSITLPINQSADSAIAAANSTHEADSPANRV
jgi:two-component system, NtrC family, sensor histidine kinase PilS